MKNNIKKISWIPIVIGMLILGISLFIILDYFHEKKMVSQVCNDQECFTVELARTQAEQTYGLMNRTYMAETSGMVFVFDASAIHSFWMKNTLIPLDMLWINEKYTVVHIITAQPCKTKSCPIYTPETSAKYVLEINAGMAAKYGIQEGTTMEFRNINE